MNLREAREQGKLREFIAEHKGDAPGDAKAFDRTLSAMAGKEPPPIPPAPWNSADPARAA